MPGDDTSSIIYTAIVEEIEQGKKRIRLNIDEIGDAFITKKVWPKQMKTGEKLEVKISHHLPTKRWLVSEIVSIEGEPYTSPEPEPKKEKSKPKPKPKKIESKPNRLRGQTGKRNSSDDEREFIFTASKKQKMVTTVPFSSLSNELSISLFTKLIEQEGSILVTLFRDTMSGLEYEGSSKPIGEMAERKLNFHKQLEDKFPTYHVELFDWPNVMRSSYDNQRSVYPYVSYRCRASAIISKNNIIEDYSHYESTLLEAVRNELIENRDAKKWLIIGDETGDFTEFTDRPSDQSKRWFSNMCWLAIPPHVSLPYLDIDFHCAGPEGESEYLSAIETLHNHDDVLLFTFTYEEGKILKKGTKFAQDPHLAMWQNTLPLVLEKISNEFKVGTKVDIFIEQVGVLEAGTALIQPVVSKYVGLLNDRENWSKLKFEELWVVNKDEHPWLGYADALGANINNKMGYNNRKVKGIFAGSVFSRIHKSPYRQSSLNGPILQALNDSSRPLRFLESLHDIEANDLRDYIRPFFGNAIKESLDSLNTEEWQDLLEHIDTHSRDKKGQRATAIIHDFINIDEVLGLLDGSPNVQFDLLRMMLGTSNHRGAMSEGFLCKEICEEMLNSGFEPPEEKLQKFNNLLSGLRDNMFDFDESFNEIPEYTSKMISTEIHNLGTIAQSLGLTGNQDNREIAVQIEEKLSQHGDNRRHISRHSILLSELLIEQEEITRAHEILEKLTYDSQNSFWFASILKCVALGKTPIPSTEPFLKDMLELLDDDHPSQRIAYWFARWAIQVGEEKEAPAQKCIEHLLSLTEVPLFSHDAPGVILSCELMDLESRGYEIKIDTMKFYELVKKNSQPSTTEWLKKHPPNEDDWLAPLNFNYR
jgi:hypothetical protein